MFTLKIRKYLGAITYEVQHLFLFYHRLTNQVEFYGKLVYQTSFFHTKVLTLIRSFASIKKHYVSFWEPFLDMPLSQTAFGRPCNT